MTSIIKRILAVAILILFVNLPSGAFEIRAANLDFRAEVMTMPAMKCYAANLAEMGYNALIVEWEGTFPFERNATLRNRYAFTRAEVEGFISFCDSLGIDVIPLQNCFGHCEYILRHDRYYGLREDKKEISQICPSKIEDASYVMKDIISEVASLHKSKYIHIGADETRLLGFCPECAKTLHESGPAVLYGRYLKAMCDIVIGLGKIPVIWGDILLKYPEAISMLPKNVVVVDWCYGNDPNHAALVRPLIDSGLEVWGASSFRSSPDNLYSTSWKMHFDNMKDFIPFARKAGYSGIVNTSWSTSGQYGFLYDASWEVLDMYPIRYAYPASAFHIMLKAFSCAVSSNSPLDEIAFVKGYAAERYGLDRRGGDILWKFFSMPQPQYAPPTVDTRELSDELLSASDMRDSLLTLKPIHNCVEFSQYILMLDIRINYLQFKNIEVNFETEKYIAENGHALALSLRKVIDDARNLEDRFLKLNGAYLKEPQAQMIFDTYMTRMFQMEQVLTANH